MNSRIEIKVKDVIFSSHSISYKVEAVDMPIRFRLNQHLFFCNKNIVDKDLIPVNTMLYFGEKTVFAEYNDILVFKPHNVTPQFYKRLYEKIDIKFNEHLSELDAIYSVGDVIGYIYV